MARTRTDLPIWDENPLHHCQFNIFEKAIQSMKLEEPEWKVREPWRDEGLYSLLDNLAESAEDNSIQFFLLVVINPRHTMQHFKRKSIIQFYRNLILTQGTNS
jgi:hypothetical protein